MPDKQDKSDKQNKQDKEGKWTSDRWLGFSTSKEIVTDDEDEFEDNEDPKEEED